MSLAKAGGPVSARRADQQPECAPHTDQTPPLRGMRLERPRLIRRFCTRALRRDSSNSNNLCAGSPDFGTLRSCTSGPVRYCLDRSRRRAALHAVQRRGVDAGEREEPGGKRSLNLAGAVNAGERRPFGTRIRFTPRHGPRASVTRTMAEHPWPARRWHRGLDGRKKPLRRGCRITPAGDAGSANPPFYR